MPIKWLSHKKKARPDQGSAFRAECREHVVGTACIICFVWSVSGIGKILPVRGVQCDLMGSGEIHPCRTRWDRPRDPTGPSHRASMRVPAHALTHVCGAIGCSSFWTTSAPRNQTRRDVLPTWAAATGGAGASCGRHSILLNGPIHAFSNYTSSTPGRSTTRST